MKKLLLVLIAFSCLSLIDANAQGGGYQNCGLAFTVDFTNDTDCDIGINWEYNTNCTKLLIGTADTFYHLGYIPANTAPVSYHHIVNKIRSTGCWNGDNGPLGLSNCTKPGSMILNVNGLIFTVDLLSTLYNGGSVTICGWYDCGGTANGCVTFTQITSTHYEVDFHY